MKRPDKEFIVAAYYWPDYHPDPRMEGFFGPGWTEYQIIAASPPKYEGHHQPRVPLWGPENEADPRVMSQKIAAAADHGINCWIMDWYWYDNRPFLEEALNRGLLQAPNRDRIRFALMWANHTFVDIFPWGRPDNRGTLWPGEVDRAIFDSAVDHILAQGYFAQPNYLRLDGEIYFSIYELGTLIKGLGGIEPTRTALESFRQKVHAAGLGEMNLNAILWQIPELPAAVPGDREKTRQDVLEQLGIDSLSTYTWAHTVPLDQPYDEWSRQASEQRRQWAGEFSIPYIPNVTIGWDNNSRNLGPLVPHIRDSTPEKFQRALIEAKHFVENEPRLPKMITINSWNEWPEGSYLEPDEKFAYGYLEAVRNIFGEK